MRILGLLLALGRGARERRLALRGVRLEDDNICFIIALRERLGNCFFEKIISLVVLLLFLSLSLLLVVVVVVVVILLSLLS